MNSSAKLPKIRDFYAGKEIFITGGTGYLGKVLIEKLLRSCPDVKSIYILIRPKKGQSPEDRLKNFTEDIVFDLIRERNPESLNKLQCISGDVRSLGLGISDEDFQRVRKCSIVIHGAANVRFDETLSESILMNTRGTRETLFFAKRLDKVEIFNHISTTFCNAEFQSSEEKIYPIHVNWRDAIKLAENLDVETFECLAKIYTDFSPNSYIFSKRLSEHLVNELRHECNFPVAILRPSVVSPSVDEPFPGFIDNFNGPFGIIAAVGCGIYRFTTMDPDSSLDYQPVDIVGKSIILSTWKEANVTKKLDEDVPVYNSSSFGKYNFTIRENMEQGMQMCMRSPLKDMIWYPKFTFIKNSFYHTFLTVVFLAIPGNILDHLLDKFNIKTKFRLSKLVRKLFYVERALEYFNNHRLSFCNLKCMALDNDIPADEYLTFHQDVAAKKIEYIDLSYNNARWYLLKDSGKDVERMKKKMILLKTLHFILQGVVWWTIIYTAFVYLRKVEVVKELYFF